MSITLIQVQNGARAIGARQLFSGATFAINEGDHVGLIGPNGAGKTTLFKILLGFDALGDGEIVRSQSLRLAYLEQEEKWQPGETVGVYLEKSIQVPFWEIERKAPELGLNKTDFTRPIRELSGGYRMRVKLLALWGQNPNVMLLDEPTNFLDLETLLILEKFLLGYEGAFLLISHDREFLRRTTDHTLEIEQGEVTKFNGHIDDYFEQKIELREMLAKRAANPENKRKHIQEFVDRFRAKATKAKQAQSRMKALEKMESTEIKALPVTAKIKLPPPVQTGEEIISVENGELGYADKTVLQNLNFRLKRGDHLGVVGVNGAGKSTFLKGLAQALPLKKGHMKVGLRVDFGYFAQHVSESLVPTQTVYEALESASHSTVMRQDILDMAGSLLFAGEDIYKKIGVLSGGEKSRVALGQILLKKAPCLLLDEPTNHLDMSTVEALTAALAHYEGSVVVVSHDRGFIRRVSSKILEIRNGRAEFYPGTYDEYVWSLQKGALAEILAQTQAQEPLALQTLADIQPDKKFNFKESRKQLESQIKKSQREIEKIEANLIDLHTKIVGLTDELNQSSGAKAQKLAQELGLLSQNNESLENDLLQHFIVKDQAEQDLKKLLGNS